MKTGQESQGGQGGQEGGQQDPAQVEKALAHVARTLPEMAKAGLVDAPDAAVSRIRGAGSLTEALDGTGFIQENIVERAGPKQELFAAIEDLCPAEAVISSSTSAIMPSSDRPCYPTVKSFGGTVGTLFGVRTATPPVAVPLASDERAHESGTTRDASACFRR